MCFWRINSRKNVQRNAFSDGKMENSEGNKPLVALLYRISCWLLWKSITAENSISIKTRMILCFPKEVAAVCQEAKVLADQGVGDYDTLVLWIDQKDITVFILTKFVWSRNGYCCMKSDLLPCSSLMSMRQQHMLLRIKDGICFRNKLLPAPVQNYILFKIIKINRKRSKSYYKLIWHIQLK